MFFYIIKRTLLFIPTLVIISIIAFGLSKLTPGDPVYNFIDRDPDPFNSLSTQEQQEFIYCQQAIELGLDKPLFYFTIGSSAYPDTLYKILISEKKETRENLITQYGNWPLIDQYLNSLDQLITKTVAIKDSSSIENIIFIKKRLNALQSSTDEDGINYNFREINKSIARDSLLTQQIAVDIKNLAQQYQNLDRNNTNWKHFVPRINFYGLDNQYHNWITQFVGWNEKLGLTSSFPFLNWEPDFGRSYNSGNGNKPVSELLLRALKWTLIMNVVSMFITFIVSVPIGVYAAQYKGSWFDRNSSLLLFIFYSIPIFWFATLIVVFIGPPIGPSELSDSAPFWSRFWDQAKHMAFPILCLSINNFAFTSRQMRASMISVNQEDYIRTAKAKGLSKRVVTWRHSFRNALFPLITIMAGIFPRIISGAVVIEVIFNFPGVGRLVYDAMMTRDWPIVYTTLMITATLTIIGILVSDMIYAKLDPRVTYQRMP